MMLMPNAAAGDDDDDDEYQSGFQGPFRIFCTI